MKKQLQQLATKLIDSFKSFWIKHVIDYNHSDPYSSDTVVDFVKASWKLQEQIQQANSDAECEALYWEVSDLVDTYMNLVPGNVIMNHESRLYHEQSKRKNFLRNKAKLAF